MVSNNLEAALMYARRGIPVFPCNYDPVAKEWDRKPRTDNGFYDATTYPKQIRLWWEAWSNARIGMPTGAHSKLSVLDLDMKDGKNGLALVPGWETLSPAIVSTPNNGRHLYFSDPEGTVGSSINVHGLMGVDTRGEGGYVILPSPLGGYRWVNGSDLHSLPPFPDMYRPPPRVERDPSSIGETTAEIDRLRAALEVVPPCEDYDGWYRVGMAVYTASGGSQQGLALFDEWSRRAKNYGGVDEKWAAFDRRPPRELGAGTIFHLADKADIGWRSRFNAAAIEHGRQQWAVISAGFANKTGPEMSNVPPLPPPPEGKFSPLAIKAVLDITEGIDQRFLHECTPPGLFGELCSSVAQGMYEPFLKFGITSSLATLSGICGRHVKLWDDQGLNIFLLLFAKSATGKTQSVKAIEKILHHIRIGTNDPHGLPLQFKDFLHIVNIDSRQGAHEIFQNHPSMCWTHDECSATLDLAVNPPKGTSASAVSDMINKLFDESEVGNVYNPPQSIRSKTSGEIPIPNLNVSIYWCTTVSNAEKIIRKEFVDTGLASRVLPIMHVGAGGVEHDDMANRLRALPDGELRRRLKQVIVDSQKVHGLYNSSISVGNQDEVLKSIFKVNMAPDAAAYYEVMRKRLGVFKRAIQDGRSPYPDTYMMLTRIAMVAPRIAGLIGYFNWREGAYVVSLEELQWSVGYCARNIGLFLTSFDRNIFGATLSDGERTVILAIKELVRKSQHDGAVSRMALGRLCRERAPFRSNREDSKGNQELRQVVKELVDDGALMEVAVAGMAGKFLRTTNHRCWQDV